MGESQGTLFQPEFNRSIEVEARPERLSADTGVLLLRELMERLGWSALLEEELSDPRDPARITHPFIELLRTTVLLQAQGWSDQVDVQSLHDDPVLRLAVSGRRGERPLRATRGREPAGLCSQPTLSRLYAVLGSGENRDALGRVLRATAARRAGTAHGRRLSEVTLDLDSLPLEVFGTQPGSAYNGHYGMRCYHPLIVSWDRGDYLGARLRPGNAHTADGGLEFVLPILEWARTQAVRVWLRMDAGFPEPTLLSRLEAEGVRYVARLRGNAALERLAEPYLVRPPGRPPAEGRTWLHELVYQAGSWQRPRRVVLVVAERPDAQGHLFLEHFFLLTNATVEEEGAEALLGRYRQRGTAEKDFGAWKNTLDVSLSSTPRPKRHYRERLIQAPCEAPDSFSANEARLLVSLLAANLLHRATELLERALRASVSRERFRQLVLKAAGRVLLSGRRVVVVIGAAHARVWTLFRRQLDACYPARGSPQFQALPTPA
jgi:hypothetical protein